MVVPTAIPTGIAISPIDKFMKNILSFCVVVFFLSISIWSLFGGGPLSNLSMTWKLIVLGVSAASLAILIWSLFFIVPLPFLDKVVMFITLGVGIYALYLSFSDAGLGEAISAMFNGDFGPIMTFINNMTGIDIFGEVKSLSNDLKTASSAASQIEDINNKI